MIKSPSKYLSIDFLRDLMLNKYCSHNAKGHIKEYCPIEVNALYYSKLNNKSVESYFKNDFERNYSVDSGNKSVDSFTVMIEFLNEKYKPEMFNEMNELWNNNLNLMRCDYEKQ